MILACLTCESQETRLNNKHNPRTLRQTTKASEYSTVIDGNIPKTGQLWCLDVKKRWKN